MLFFLHEFIDRVYSIFMCYDVLCIHVFSSVFDDFGANLSYQDGDLPVAGVLQSSLDMYGRLGSDMKEEASDAKAGSTWKHLEASGNGQQKNVVVLVLIHSRLATMSCFDPVISNSSMIQGQLKDYFLHFNVHFDAS